MRRHGHDHCAVREGSTEPSRPTQCSGHERCRPLRLRRRLLLPLVARPSVAFCCSLSALPNARSAAKARWGSTTETLRAAQTPAVDGIQHPTAHSPAAPDSVLPDRFAPGYLQKRRSRAVLDTALAWKQVGSLREGRLSGGGGQQRCERLAEAGGVARGGERETAPPRCPWQKSQPCYVVVISHLPNGVAHEATLAAVGVWQEAKGDPTAAGWGRERMQRERMQRHACSPSQQSSDNHPTTAIPLHKQGIPLSRGGSLTLLSAAAGPAPRSRAAEAARLSSTLAPCCTARGCSASLLRLGAAAPRRGGGRRVRVGFRRCRSALFSHRPTPAGYLQPQRPPAETEAARHGLQRRVVLPQTAHSPSRRGVMGLGNLQ